MLRDRASASLRLVAADSGRSRIGGLPHLRDGFEWPSRNSRPMPFLAEIDLAEVGAAAGPAWLPDRGMLFFFYDVEEGAWGFSPEDKGGWAVLFDPAGRTPVERDPPELSSIEQFPAKPIAMRVHWSLPSTQRLALEDLPLDDTSWNALHEAVDASDGDPPWHQIGGWPRPVQNDKMELECQLAANGINCGDPGVYASDAAKALVPGTSDWRLLLQLDSDEASGMMWGDAGMLYFWIREDDARVGDFSNVWLILQCY